MPAMPMAAQQRRWWWGAKHTNRATSEAMVVGFAMPSWLAPNPLNANSDTDTTKNDGQRDEQDLERDLVQRSSYARPIHLAIIWSRKL